MLLAIDIGNTNITVGAFDGDDLRATFRMSTDARKMADEYAILLSQMLPLRGVSRAEIGAVAICSVVPPLTSIFVHLAESHIGVRPLVVGAGTRTGVRVRYDPPRDVGADRIVDAAAAFSAHDGPVIVVDIGTATVLDAVTEDGDYLGGAIAPGVSIAADSLFHATAMLRRVELAAPPSAIGRNTVHALQSGLVFGYSELVRGMVRRFDRELGGGAKVIATGGLARIIENDPKIFDAIDPDLTLRGLKLVYDMNR